MDLVLKLRELRRMKELSQKDVAERCGVGEKTISSFETGERIGSLKLSQLQKLLEVYGITAAEFFSDTIDSRIAPWDEEARGRATARRLLDDIASLPVHVQGTLLEKFRLMVDTAAEVNALSGRSTFRSEPVNEWQMLTSRN
jgi:transcriptional regulator with XRE-family HTH domain